MEFGARRPTFWFKFLDPRAAARLLCSSMRVIAVIPARFAATRLPGKPLSDIQGKPMVQWVYERAMQARGLDRVIVATDDERIQKVVRAFGGEVILTDPALPSGTDRVAAVAEKVDAEVYVNIQGDEPMMDPLAIEAVAGLVTSGRFPMATVMRPFRSAADLENRNLVKVLADRTGRALYFSRLPIPYGRQSMPTGDESILPRNHVGLYAYTREALFRFRSLPPSSLEQAEMLEQLRALEDGIPIGIIEVDFTSFEVNDPSDLDKIRKHFAEKSAAGKGY